MLARLSARAASGLQCQADAFKSARLCIESANPRLPMSINVLILTGW
jgi:hypothetical protein